MKPSVTIILTMSSVLAGCRAGASPLVVDERGGRADRDDVVLHSIRNVMLQGPATLLGGDIQEFGCDARSTCRVSLEFELWSAGRRTGEFKDGYITLSPEVNPKHLLISWKRSEDKLEWYLSCNTGGVGSATAVEGLQSMQGQSSWVADRVVLGWGESTPVYAAYLNADGIGGESRTGDPRKDAAQYDRAVIVLLRRDTVAAR